MTIVANDIKFYLSGGVANSNPNASLGGDTSATVVPGGLHNLFDAVAPEEAVAGDVEYRAVSIKNTHVSETLAAAVAWISQETTSANSTIAIGLDATTQSVANESTAPSGVTFSTPMDKASGIALGDMGPGVEKRLWLRRTVTAGATKLASDTGILIVEGGTV